MRPLQTPEQPYHVELGPACPRRDGEPPACCVICHERCVRLAALRLATFAHRQRPPAGR